MKQRQGSFEFHPNLEYTKIRIYILQHDPNRKLNIFVTLKVIRNIYRIIMPNKNEIIQFNSRATYQHKEI